MIEKLAKTVEVTGKATEKQPDNKFDPDKRVNFEQDKVDKKLEDKSFDPDKRIEVPGAEANVNKIESNVDVNGAFKDYIDDIKSKSEYPETNKSKIDYPQLREIPKEELAEKRNEFEKQKRAFRKAWEEKNGREFPKEKKDVVSEDGTIIRKAGSCYELHHIVPLSLGGENSLDNLTPMSYSAHKELHGAGSAYSKLRSAVKGEV